MDPLGRGVDLAKREFGRGEGFSLGRPGSRSVALAVGDLRVYLEGYGNYNPTLTVVFKSVYTSVKSHKYGSRWDPKPSTLKPVDPKP